MKKIASVFLITLLAGCASGPNKCINYVECPDGLNDCVVQALETCPKGYQTLNDSDVGADFGDFAKEHFEGARNGVPHMVVTCN